MLVAKAKRPRLLGSKRTLNPAKVEMWVVRGGESAERSARRPDAPGVEARASPRQTLNPKP